MFWFAGCGPGRRGPVTAECVAREELRVAGRREKCIVRPERVDALAVHHVQIGHRRARVCVFV